MKTKLTRKQKEKMFLKFIKQDYIENPQQYNWDLDVFNKECARYYAYKWKSILENRRSTKKWATIQTKDFWWCYKHILRSEFESFKSLIA